MIYADNAATAFPRPEEVYLAMDAFQRTSAANPGRSGHRLSSAARETVEAARRKLARFFGIPKPERLAFAFNATDALNMAIHGLNLSGAHVVTTALDHNSVTRPLAMLEKAGKITVTRVNPAGKAVTPEEITAAMRATTRLVVLNHASNVTGAIQDVETIALAAHAKGAILLVDAAQTAGSVPIDVKACGIDLLAFTGHKGLLGPTGTGGLYVREGLELTPYRTGGSGSDSDNEEMPLAMPDRLEAGTLPAAGIAGLAAGIDFLNARGIANIRAHELSLVRLLTQSLADEPGVALYGSGEDGTGVLSFNVENLDPVTCASILDAEFGIAVRAGLHCAPWMHRALGTFPAGAVRASFGPFNTEAEAREIAAAIKTISKNVR